MAAEGRDGREVGAGGDHVRDERPPELAGLPADAGLGPSTTSIRYGFAGREEAVAYVAEDVLQAHFTEPVTFVRDRA